jgi:predicted TIM-barrel fold metal-dependent hydrolase
MAQPPLPRRLRKVTNMILDCHIHALPGKPDPGLLQRRLREAGIAGAVVMSPAPPSFGTKFAGGPAGERLAATLEWTAERSEMWPFFWFDPLDPAAPRQVKAALRMGFAGFKVISNYFSPCDRRAMKVYRAIAEAGRPMIFHCGILWDHGPSSRYCRPVEFEPLMAVPHLRFALAHIGWPWCDELLAVYGKNRVWRRDQPEAAEMFIDTTPGTPPIYRREALTKIFTIGYDVADNVLFGTDCLAGTFHSALARQWIRRDRAIFRALRLPAAVQGRVFARNLQRFLGEA